MSTDKQKEVGIVKALKNDIVRVEGLPSVRVNDVLCDRDGGQSLVISFAADIVEALLLGDSEYRPGDVLSHDPEGIRIPVGVETLGRIINPLGEPIDGEGIIGGKYTSLKLEVVAPGLSSRALIEDQFYTGITVIDSLVPIGKGQRELVFGEPDSGKQFFLRDIIAAQLKRDVVCIYSAIGKSAVKIKRFVDSLVAANSLAHTVVVSAAAGSPTSHLIIAPSSAMLIADEFRNAGRDVLIIMDDLGAHAKYLREVALLSRRVPGRESYPGDVFYQHAHIIERAGNFNESVGGGSITMIPVMELDIEQLSTLIPTNLVASTDGHLYFSSSLSAEGIYPAIDVERSVTRVGRRSQTGLQVEIAERTRSLLASFRDLERYSHLGAEISGSARDTLHRGALIQELLRQEPGGLIDWRSQVLLLSMAFLESASTGSVNAVREQKDDILKRLEENKSLIKFIEENADGSLKDILVKLENISPFGV